MRTHILKILVFSLILIFSNVILAVDISIPRIDPGRVKQSLEPVEVEKPAPARMAIPLVQKPSISGAAQQVTFNLQKLILEGVTVYKPAELYPLYKKYLGKKVSLADLQLIAYAITVKYHQDGYFSSQAVIPPQKITNGVAHIVVLEGYISDVIIEGDAKGARDYLLDIGDKIKKKRPININYLERLVLLADDLSGFTVKSILRPSTRFMGGSDLILVVERKRFEAQVSYDNYGSDYMGPRQVNGLLNINDAFDSADRLSLRTSDTPESNDLRFVEAEYLRPIGTNGINVLLSGNYVETRPNANLEDLNLAGKSTAVTIGANYPWLRSRRANLITTVKLDVLDSETDLPTSILFLDRIRSLRLALNYDRIDSWRGLNNANVEFSKGLSILGASKSPTGDITSRVGAKSNYSKVNVSFSRLQRLASNLNLHFLAKGQYSFHQSLLSSEEFGFGGTIIGYGYDSSEITGDSGLAGKLELRLNTTPGYRFLRNINYYVFYDIGEVWNVNSQQQARQSAASTGIGATINFNKYLMTNLEMDKPLTLPAQSLVNSHKDGNGLRGFFKISAIF